MGSAAKLWELRLSDMSPIMRMYPDIRSKLLLYVRERLLDELGFGQALALVEPEGSWNEGVVCMSHYLMQQGAVVVEHVVKELGKVGLLILHCGACSCVPDVVRPRPESLTQDYEDVLHEVADQVLMTCPFISQANAEDSGLQSLLDALMTLATSHAKRSRISLAGALASGSTAPSMPLSSAVPKPTVPGDGDGAAGHGKPEPGAGKAAGPSCPSCGQAWSGKAPASGSAAAPPAAGGQAMLGSLGLPAPKSYWKPMIRQSMYRDSVNPANNLNSLGTDSTPPADYMWSS